jgi:predicted metal-binding membrane protein
MMLPGTLPLLLAQVGNEAARVGAGRIVGGWGYVWTAYGIAWGGLSLYAVSLWMRIRRQKQAAKESP